MKMKPGTPLHVSLHWSDDDVQPVGRLAYRNRRAYLEYDPAFIQCGLQISPLHHQTGTGLQTPPVNGGFEGLHGVFHDSLPDGWGRLLVDRRARQLGIKPASLTPLDRLAIVGNAGIGALSYAPAASIWDDDSATLNLDDLAADAHRVLEGDVSDVISVLGAVGGSPGGARPKALIAINDDGHALHGNTYAPDGYVLYLVKFSGHGDPEDIAAIEAAYAAMAKEAGIAMPYTRLLEGAKGDQYFAARRFDRLGNDRVHVHSACGLLYTDIRTPSLDYADLIQLTRSVTHDQRDCEAMYALAVFNVLAHNRDDHARQFSYVMGRDGTWRLAPAYDLTFSQGPGGEHSTTVSGYGTDIGRANLLELAKKADINTADAHGLIDRVADTANRWRNFAEDYGVSTTSSRTIAKTIDAELAVP